MFLKKYSIRTRMTLLFVSIFGSTLIAFGVLTYNFLSDKIEKEFDDALFNYAIDAAESVTLNSSGDLTVAPAVMDTTKLYPFSLGTALIQIRQFTGQVLTQVGQFGDFKLPYKSDFKMLAAGEDVTFRTIKNLKGLPDAEATRYRVINFPLDDSPTPQLILQIAVPMTFVEAQIQGRRQWFQITIPLIIVISMLAGFFVSARALKPVKDMIQKARDIKVSALSERLPVPDAKDEVRNLALTLNRMLSRLEQAFQSHERFIADASHQLLTPLTLMRNELEQALKPTSAESPQDVYNSLLQEVDHLSSLVQNLLLLARVDAGFGAMSLEPIYFDDVVMDSISRAEKIARTKEIRLKFDIQNQLGNDTVRPQIRGDEDLIQNLIFNLIENAIKYSKPKSSISMALEWNLKEQIFTIEDSGPGLPKDQIQKLFDRFTRAQGTSSMAQGYGLGLAIAKQIAMIHQADLTAENRKDQSGARFQLKIKNI